MTARMSSPGGNALIMVSDHRGGIMSVPAGRVMLERTKMMQMSIKGIREVAGYLSIGHIIITSHSSPSRDS
jgi:hypothetical protein